MRLARSWFVAAVLVIPLAGCEYSGPTDGAAVSPTQGGTEQKPSFEENIDEVTRLLQASAKDPGMPSEAEPAGRLSIDLAPGDYMVRSACAGVTSVELSIAEGESAQPLTVPYTCDSILERFVRHAGGPITISATTPLGKPAATGVTVQPNTDQRASEVEDMREWSSLHMQPGIPGQFAAAKSSDTATSFGFSSAEPGKYEVHFICEGPPEAQFSVSSKAGAEVLAPLRVPCNGDAFIASVELSTKGADFNMAPSNGAEGRYVVRLVPSP